MQEWGRDLKVAVFFGAHADDIELGAGGTCAKLSASGVEVHVVIATDEADAKVAGTRRGEAVTAAGVLGVPAERVHFLGFRDGAVHCDRASVSKARALLAERGLRPDIVFTHTEWDSHQDHVELTRIVRGTVRQAVLFKYVVRNSAIVSHFTPSIYSAVDDFMAAKSAALCEHQSQVAVGRVDVDVFLNFAKRYSFNLDRRHFEAFDLEVQEGVSGAVGLVDLVNDAPFSRLWQPICGKAGVTVIPGLQRTGSSGAVLEGAPSDLQLVTRLQSELTRMLQGMGEVHAADMLVVAPARPTALEAVTGGACILLGGPDVNSVTRSLLANQTGLRYQMDIASDRYGGSLAANMR